MVRTAKYLLVLIALAAAGLAVYAALTDLPAPVREITVDVPLPGRG